VTDVMRERGTVVNSAAQMLSSGDVNLDTMPQLILRIINEDMWRQRAIPQKRWELTREFGSFEEFVTTSPLDGLGTSVQMIRDLCRRLPTAQEAIDRAVKEAQPHGGDRRSEAFKCNNITLERPPAGTAQAKALRRLRKDRPDLLVRVQLPKDDPGRLSAHAAAVLAGYRHETITIRADDPQHAAQTLRRHYTDPEQLALLIKYLQKED
jgi:hypothetical protein